MTASKETMLEKELTPHLSLVNEPKVPGNRFGHILPTMDLCYPQIQVLLVCGGASHHEAAHKYSQHKNLHAITT